MRVAIVHYHLKPGGVTRVIENAVQSLQDLGVECVVLSGRAYEGTLLQNTQVVEGLDYRSRGDDGGPDGERLANNLLAGARKGLGGREPDLWHIHNHSLGKNVVFPAALNRLLHDGQRALLQVHDFAEDGRPANYARQQAYLRTVAEAPLYPRGEAVHYCTLNQRDHDLLRQTGLGADEVSVLPNSIHVPELPEKAAQDPCPGGGRVFVYPTRGIRRKNMGEFCLLAALGEAGDWFASTLPPSNPEWQGIHQRWVAVAAELGLPVQLGAVAEGEYGFEDWLARADGLVTTSVAEGFGLAFMEPALFGKPLRGRNLPAITADFSALGYPLDRLYEALWAPLECLDETSLRKRLQGQLEVSFAAYGRVAGEAEVEASWQSITREGQIDFGALDETAQEEALRAVRRECGLKAVLRAQAGLDDLSDAQAKSKRQLVERHYGNAAYGQRLKSVYAQLTAAEAGDVTCLDAAKVLNSFLNPKHFRLLLS